MPETSTTAVARLFSWLRQGLHAGITAAQGSAVTTDGHLPVPIRLRINNADEIDVPVRLYGPGDVTGIDPREVIRTEPHAQVTDFEPNYFPFIEFDLPDFPWLFTPAAPDTAGHLQPWICLVVVPKESSSVTVTPNQPLPVLQCPRRELPNLAESWAWAHSQIVEGSTPAMDPSLDEKAQKNALGDMLKRYPERSVSRILCPRRLDPNTRYHACLVPTFEVGCKAGLGDPVTVDDERTLKPAWLSTTDAPGTDSIRLPVYFHWEFSTGFEGDFEALARRLVPRTLPPTVGLRPMDISRPDWGMPELTPDSAGTVLGLEGALRTPDTEPTPWPDAARVSFQTALRNILNAPAEHTPSGSEPAIVGPPLYGQWHAKQRIVPDGGDPPHWFRELNLDPRHRVAAGLGTLVIRFEQEQLMASAWDQLAQHELDDRRLRRAQLSEAVGQALDEKHFQPLPPSRFLQVTAPVHAVLGRERVPKQVPKLRPTQPLVSAAFRRMARQRGPLARRLAFTARQKPTIASGQTTVTQHLLEGLAGLGTLAGFLGMVAKPRAALLRSVSATVVAPRTEVPTDTAMIPIHLAKTSLLKELEPRLTVLAAVREDIPEAQSTDLVRFAPEFPQPMYEPLRDYFEDSLLPGLEQVLPNTITLLETNPRFIEAYMVGLNHEMSRELLWRGFPTDQRGTCFRQFWDIRGRVPLPTEAERKGLMDIPPITDWPDSTELGENAGQGSTEGQIVLLLRGDLLRRYSRAIIYAAEAAWSEDGTRRELGSEERYPLFRATRQPDVTMLGFPLTEEQVKGADSVSEGHPGWFFVLQQQPTEPRFGLDVPTSYGGLPEHWSDLSWGHMAADEKALQELVYVPIDGLLQGKTLDNVPWGKNSAHMAFITRQRPFRVAIHARTWLTGA